MWRVGGGFGAAQRTIMGTQLSSLAAADFELDDELRRRITALTPDPPPATDRSEEVAGG